MMSKSLALMLISLCATAGAEEWTQFLGGPRHAGCGEEKYSEVSNPRLLWKTALEERPMLMAHPLVVAGMVYVANMDGRLVALDAETGKEKLYPHRSADELRAGFSSRAGPTQRFSARRHDRRGTNRLLGEG